MSSMSLWENVTNHSKYPTSDGVRYHTKDIARNFCNFCNSIQHEHTGPSRILVILSSPGLLSLPDQIVSSFEAPVTTLKASKRLRTLIQGSKFQGLMV